MADRRAERSAPREPEGGHKLNTGTRKPSMKTPGSRNVAVDRTRQTGSRENAAPGRRRQHGLVRRIVGEKVMSTRRGKTRRPNEALTPNWDAKLGSHRLSRSGS